MMATSGYARSVRSRLTRPGRDAIPGPNSGVHSFDSSTSNGSGDGAATATGMWRARGRRTGNAADDDDIRPLVYEQNGSPQSLRREVSTTSEEARSPRRAHARHTRGACTKTSYVLAHRTPTCSVERSPSIGTED